MAKKNTNLHNAKKAKNDEFYTQLSDIEKEMAHYKEFFKGKIVYCNCDDARESNFFKFFANNFESLGLKKLISTGFKENGKGVKLVYEGDKNGNFMVDDEEIAVTELEGNGDFRSEECIELLKECDVVVTNPPFSLFREYVAQLMEYGKKFLVIGPQNAVTYKEIFPLLKDNKIWWGTDCVRWFIVSEEMGKTTKVNYKGETIAEGDRSRWFTNIPHTKRNEELDLFKKYNETDYPKYDNYDAIEVSRVENIPMDYDGVMGVPITFLDKYCPTQFEIVDINPHFYSIVEQGLPKPKQLKIVGRKDPYARILIRRKRKEEQTTDNVSVEESNNVEVNDNVSVNVVEPNNVQQTNNTEMTNTIIPMQTEFILTRRPYSDEDMYIDSITIKNGTEFANKHNITKKENKTSTSQTNNRENEVKGENLPP